jgi:short-subunit dehydrogenase
MKALVTGASGGIGYEIAKYLAQKGYDLVVVARSREGLEKLKKEVKTQVNVICMDLAQTDNCMKLYEELRNQDIDVLVNNAGFGLFGEQESIDLQQQINMIDLNVKAVTLLTQLFLRDMKKRNAGYILNVGSLAGFQPGPLMCSYYATKAYVLRFTQGIHKELKKSKSNVSVSVLCPGPTKTNFSKTAGVEFSFRPLDSAYVAKYGIDKMLRKKLIIIPGFLEKFLRIAGCLAPDTIVAEMVYYIQKKRCK